MLQSTSTATSTATIPTPSISPAATTIVPSRDSLKIAGGAALAAAAGYGIYVLSASAFEESPNSHDDKSVFSWARPYLARFFLEAESENSRSKADGHDGHMVVDERALRAMMAQVALERSVHASAFSSAGSGLDDSSSVQSEYGHDDEDMDFLRSHVGAKCIAGLHRSDAVPAWPALLPCRKFITGGNGFAAAPASSNCESDFSVFSMNVLADGLSGLASGAAGFTQIPSEGLDWSNRKYRIMDEILNRNPDVVCLQEVDHFHDWFEPQLSKIGYAGVFREDPFSPCLKTGSGLCDGVAVFYRRSKLDMIALESLHMSSTHIRKKGKDKGTEAGRTIMCKFRIRNNNKQVANQQPLIGLEVQQPWAEKLLNGERVIETRAYALPDGLLHHPIKIIETPPGGMDLHGSSKARVIGEVIFREVRRYEGRADFVNDQPFHCVEAENEVIGWDSREDSDKPKFGWVVESVKREAVWQPTCGSIKRAFRSLFRIGAPAEVIVVNTHLESSLDDKGSEKRWSQMQNLLDTLEDFVRLGVKDTPEDVIQNPNHEIILHNDLPPVVLCGDFNAKPDEPCLHSLATHQLQFRDAYTMCGLTPEFTAMPNRKYPEGFEESDKYHEEGLQKKTSDYIMVSSHLDCIGVLDCPTADEIGGSGLPSLSWPSDHLSLMASFRLK